MKHSLKIRKSAQYFSAIILLLALALSTLTTVSPVLAGNWADQENATTSDVLRIKATIKDYFTQRYEMRKMQVKPAGYASLYSSVIENADSAWLQQEKDRLEILQTITEETHFNFTAYKFSLVYQGIKVNGNLATVSLLENNELSYPGSSEPSLLGNLSHMITLKKNARGAWRITRDDYLDDTLKSMVGVSKADVLNTIHNNLSAMQQTLSSENNEPVDSPSILDDSVHANLTAYPYNGASAARYADAHWNKAGTVPGYVKGIPGWQSNWPTSYKLYPGVGESGDCTNFASQAIFMGSDYTASDANYFYPNSAHYNDWWYYKFSPTVNGSYPWTNVGELYKFLTVTNVSNATKGRGPYGVKWGTPATTGCGLAPGDVIMMKNAAGAWRHTVIVRARATTNCAYPPYAFVDAHSNNVRNAPLANYMSFKWFPVHIQGYRE